MYRPKTYHTDRPSTPLFASLFSGEGKLEYMGWDTTEHRGKRLEQQPCMAFWTRLKARVGVACFCTVMEAWHTQGFSRDAQQQATTNCRCHFKAFELYITNGDICQHCQVEKSRMPLSGSWISAINFLK